MKTMIFKKSFWPEYNLNLTSTNVYSCKFHKKTVLLWFFLCIRLGKENFLLSVKTGNTIFDFINYLYVIRYCFNCTGNYMYGGRCHRVLPTGNSGCTA